MTATTKISYGQALSEAIRMEMHRNPAVVCVAAADTATSSVVTGDLADAFGPGRIVEVGPQARPVAVAAGMAARGMRVVCEARADQLGPEALAPLGELDEAADGAVVLRVQDGGPETAAFVTPVEERLYDTAAVKVLAPATPADAKGMLVGSIRADGATCVLESEALYASVGDVPEGRHVVQPGSAVVEAFGARASVISYGLGAALANRAAVSAGLAVEVIDLRSLRPLDAAAIVASTGRTGKVAVIEPGGSTRVSAEVAGLLMTSAFEYLDGPLARIEIPEWAGAEARRDEAAARIAARIDELVGY